MNVHDTRKWCVAGSLLALTFGVTTALFAQPIPTNVEQGVQVLTRGPVHEAFAETVTFDPEPGIVTPKAPPAAIEEVPPEQRPEGDNVTWIPGYWAWDDERDDFLWISGIWRALPPGRQWVPGYWGKSGQGFQWTSGYWADAESSEVEYLPEPPATVEGRSQYCRALGRPNVAAGLLDPAEQSLCLASGVLVGRATELGLGSRSLRLGSSRLRLYRRLLGLSRRSPRRALCSSVFSGGHGFAARFFLHADDGDRSERLRHASLYAAAVPALLFWRLLRRRLPRCGVPPLVFNQHRAFRLRSDLRA